MGKYVTEEPYDRVRGALCFLQIWTFAYFPEISGVDSFPLMSLGLSATQSIRTISTNVATSEPNLTRLADPDSNPWDARPKPSIKSIYSYKRFRSQIFAEAVSI